MVSAKDLALQPFQLTRKTSVFLADAASALNAGWMQKKTRPENHHELAAPGSSFFGGIDEAMTLMGYMRISKSDGSQVLHLLRDALLAAGVDPAPIYADLDAGLKDDRPGLPACLKALQPGNTLVVWKLNRLGRDLKHLVNTIDDLSQRNVGLNVLASASAQIDTTTANGRLAFGIFAALAEFEAELIRERTRAGLAAARARGHLGGVRAR